MNNEALGAPEPQNVVKLSGLYDDSRREELAMQLIPVLSGQCETINMTDVEHIDIAAVLSLLPALESRFDDHKAFINVIGMNEDVRSTLKRCGLLIFFRTSAAA